MGIYIQPLSYCVLIGKLKVNSFHMNGACLRSHVSNLFEYSQYTQLQYVYPYIVTCDLAKGFEDFFQRNFPLNITTNVDIKGSRHLSQMQTYTSSGVVHQYTQYNSNSGKQTCFYTTVIQG